MESNRKIKIGIDVGGTFTHAVAIDIKDFSIVGKSCVPTSHNAKEGVAKGVVAAMNNLMDDAGITANEVILIAHSTTQATNALLEGDVATVGIIGMGKGLEGKKAKKDTNLCDIELSPGKLLPVRFAFIDTKKRPAEEEINEKIDQLVAEGAEVFVASEAFGVDNQANEEFVCNCIESKGFMATAASRISQLYGLKVRTRTAVINASMMPKMLETANMTEKSVRESGIKAPLMVMRSDGGIMDIDEMRKRPILTMLSGPAAGVAAALMYVKISDGVFLEVGGTSTDISIIKNGKPQVKSAQIGGNRLYLKTLDVRTLGIAGGSVPRIKGNDIIDVGPRSAHIANLHYSAFAEKEEFNNIQLQKVKPIEGDPADYVALKTADPNSPDYTVTPTGASYLLNLVKSVGHGSAKIESVKKSFAALGKLLDKKPEDLAKSILEISASKIKPVVNRLLREYKLDPELVHFVGGGGGASALVPFTANYMDVPHEIAENTEVISAIGAALGMIRDSVERNIMNPTEADIIRLRQQASDSVIRMGAVPETVEVTIEIDNKNKKVIATAMGTSEMRTRDLEIKELSEEQLLNICATSFKTKRDLLLIAGRTNNLTAVIFRKVNSFLFGMFSEEETQCRIIDKEGTIKLQLNDCLVDSVQNGSVKPSISRMIETLTTFGDAGALVPDIYMLIGPRVVDLSGMITETQVLAIADMELKDVPDSEEVIVIARKKK